MKKVIKKSGKTVMAYQLGTDSRMEQDLMAAGKIRRTPDGRYELFSQEAVNGTGELADQGDYFKVDSTGNPYPNDRAWFEANHIHVEGQKYVQLPKPLDAWEADEPMCPEIEFLLKTGRLKINQETPERYFEAFLWGSLLTAARTAVVIFYQVDRGSLGEIEDISFGFVERGEFELTYDYCQQVLL